MSGRADVVFVANKCLSRRFVFDAPLQEASGLGGRNGQRNVAKGVEDGELDESLADAITRGLQWCGCGCGCGDLESRVQ